MKKNNNKKFRLDKERVLKKMFEKEPGVLQVTRSRGSFGKFDIQVFFEDYILLISVKSTRKQYVSYKEEIKLLQHTTVPKYCKKALYVYYAKHKKRTKQGWIVEYKD